MMVYGGHTVFEKFPDFSLTYSDFHSPVLLIGWLVGFVALRPKSTAMAIAGRSVHLTTLFPGQA